jgi:hypothetical protein
MGWWNLPQWSADGVQVWWHTGMPTKNSRSLLLCVFPSVGHTKLHNHTGTKPVRRHCTYSLVHKWPWLLLLWRGKRLLFCRPQLVAQFIWPANPTLRKLKFPAEAHSACTVIFLKLPPMKI